MTRDNIEAQCRKISANYSSSGVCRFTRGGGVLCFIDTSQEQNGTRGIAFARDKMTVFFGSGRPSEITFDSIKELRIISSFEDFCADELSIVGEDYEVRISDYSLDKSELKRFIEELRIESEKASAHRAQAEEYAKIIAERLAESTLREERAAFSEPLPAYTVPVVAETKETAEISEETHEPDELITDTEAPVILESDEINISNGKMIVVPEDYIPAPIPEEKINWLSGSFYEKKIEASAETPSITVAEPESAVDEPEMSSEPEEAEGRDEPEEVEGIAGIEDLVAPVEMAEPSESESGEIYEIVRPEWPGAAEEQEQEKADRTVESDGEALAQIQNMSREETLSFLAESLSEINDADSESEDDQRDSVIEEENTLSDFGADLKTISEISAPPDNDRDDGKLTVEPIWGDIYIKASRNLRELVESGKLSMEQIEAELKDKLLSSAKAFVEITADETKVPKVLMPKITELKSAVGDFDEYFKSGEDIAVRAMFFMLYQMLSYADRIAETPETKERLNDFFRRFGPAGITLSMLDMRV